MERKFKAGPYRLMPWATAAVLLLLAADAESTTLRVGLALGALLLVADLYLGQRRHRLPRAGLPLLLGGLITLALFTAPQRYLLWLWAWAAVLALPQHGVLRWLNVGLAALSFWHVHSLLGVEEALLAGLLLATLGLLGVAHGLSLRGLWRDEGSPGAQLSGLDLHSRRQLDHDLALETVRTQREGSHGMLVLLRTPPSRQRGVARALVGQTRRYEHGYRIDRATLALLLISRDAGEVQSRRGALLAALPPGVRTRCVSLVPGVSLNAQLEALAGQQRALVTLEETA